MAGESPCTAAAVTRSSAPPTSDHDLVVFLEGDGVADPEAILEDPQWVEWRGGPAYEFSAR